MVPSGITVIQWVTDFSERVKQLQTIVAATTSGGVKELKVQREEQYTTSVVMSPVFTQCIHGALVPRSQICLRLKSG